MPSEDEQEVLLPLREFLLASVDDQVSVDADTLLDLLRPLGPFAEPVRDLAFLQLTGDSDTPLELRLGKWRWDATRGAVQSAVTTAVLLPVCVATGTTGIPVVVLAAVLPFLVAVEQIEVRDSDLHVLATIRDELFLPNDIERVYTRLPDDLKHEVTLLEFRDLVQRLTEAGRLRRDRLGRFQMTEQAFRETRALVC